MSITLSKVRKLLSNSWSFLEWRRFGRQKANTDNEDIKQMKMPNEGKMKNPNMAKWRSQKIWQNEEAKKYGKMKKQMKTKNEA